MRIDPLRRWSNLELRSRATKTLRRALLEQVWHACTAKGNDGEKRGNSAAPRLA
ncbi:MAG: hypothetical protein ABW003_05695 [Microvirga sp.]